MKNILIFDLDGTLLNTLGDLTEAVNFALSGLSLPNRTIDEIRSFIGNGVPTLIKRSLPENSDSDTFERALKLFTEWYMSHICDKTVPFDYIPGLLKLFRSKGYKIAIVSNKKHEATLLVCEKLLCGLYDYAAGAKNEKERKPSPDMVLKAMEFFGCEKDSAVYIGDSEVDVQTAKNAGIDCISVLWGYRSKEELSAAGGKIFAKDVPSLTEIVLTL